MVHISIIYVYKIKLYANKKIHKNWQNINSKVQLAGDLPEITRGRMPQSQP